MHRMRLESRSMHTPFFPLADPEEVVRRDMVFLSEYHVYPDPDMPIWKYMRLTTEAHLRREARIKAAQDGKQFIG